MIFHCQTVQQARDVRRAFKSIERVARSDGIAGIDIEFKLSGVWVDDATGEYVFTNVGGSQVVELGRAEYVLITLPDDGHEECIKVRMYPDDTESIIKAYVS